MAISTQNDRYGFFDSPLGCLLITGDGDQLHTIRFPTEEKYHDLGNNWYRDDSCFAEVFKQLHAYFAGELKQFSLPVRFAGTEFQNRVWNALSDIPYGETISYGTLASRIGNPKACRAVGGANGANPIPIVIPCHRVIGSDKSLTGFGGGTDLKKYLLDHEQRVLIKRFSGMHGDT